MKIVAAHLVPYALPFKAAWRNASGDQQERRGWLLELRDADGRSGWGECAPLPSHGSEDHATARMRLLYWQATLPGQRAAQILARLSSPDSFASPAARAAVECALLDLLAQAQGKPLNALLDGKTGEQGVPVNAAAGTVGDATLIDNAIARGFRVIKLKLGLETPAVELAALEALAARLPPGVALRLDANRAWDLETAFRMLAALAALPVESVEEPLAIPDLTQLALLQDKLPFPLALDESMGSIDAGNFWRSLPVRRVVCKIAPLGGLLPAAVLFRRAASAGVECVVTTGVDGAAATLAASHLAAAFGGIHAHGLATSEWLAEDLGQPPHIQNGLLILSAASGLGFTPSSEAVPRPLT